MTCELDSNSLQLISKAGKTVDSAKLRETVFEWS